MIEVWLLETNYDDYEDGCFQEMYLHIPNTNIWLTNTSLYEEEIHEQRFTELFWKRQGQQHLFTKLGEF